MTGAWRIAGPAGGVAGVVRNSASFARKARVAKAMVPRRPRKINQQLINDGVGALRSSLSLNDIAS